MMRKQYYFHIKKKELLRTATYFFFPKKHMPMLFQRGGLSGTTQAATRYLFMATSKSPWVCIMLPAARMAWGRNQTAGRDEKKRTEDDLLFH